MKFIAPFFLLALMACSSSDEAFAAPELGLVKWQTDHNQALALSRETGKPVFLLFQEVPG